MALDLSEEFGSDEKAEIEGVWVSLDGDEAKVRVARLGNIEAQRAYRHLPRQIRRQIEEGTLGTKQARRFMAEFISQNLLKDWKGLADNGKTLAYSLDAATAMLLKHRRFRDRIWELACDEELFNIAEIEQDAKN